MASHLFHLGEYSRFVNPLISHKALIFKKRIMGYMVPPKMYSSPFNESTMLPGGWSACWRSLVRYENAPTLA